MGSDSARLPPSSGPCHSRSADSVLDVASDEDFVWFCRRLRVNLLPRNFWRAARVADFLLNGPALLTCVRWALRSRTWRA